MSSSIGDDLGFTLPGGGLVDKDGHHKVHPLSPIVHVVAIVPALIGVGLAIVVPNGFSLARWIPELTPVVSAILAISVASLLLSMLVAGYYYLAWRALSFWIDADGDFRITSGVVFRQERRVQLSRLQTVDVIQPLAARIFSIAVLTLEVAGQDDSRVSLKFLTLADARELRRVVMVRASRLAEGVEEAPQEVLARVSTKDLAFSLLMRSSTVFLLLATVALLGFSFLTEGWAGATLALVTGSLPVIIVFSEFLRYYGFTVAQSPDGLRLRYGLLRTESRTVPTGRVQAIDYVEPFFWRKRRWTRVRINIAGVGTSSGDSSNQKETLLIPVATREHAEDLAARLMPELVLRDRVWVSAPPQARWRSPIQWRQLAISQNAESFAARRGRVTRHLIGIPHARTQSVRYTQGPWERWLNLASVHVDTTPGPVKVDGLHLAQHEALDAARTQADLAQQGRASITES